MNRIPFLVGACILSLVAMSGFAAADDPTADALAAAQAWVSQIDAGQFNQSYEAGCTALHTKVEEHNWVLALQAARARWGDLVSRREISHIYKPDGIEGLEGECMIINYETSFKNVEAASEMVVLKLEDGKWRGAGYTCGPRRDQDAQEPDQTPDAPQTTISDTTTTKPQ